MYEQRNAQRDGQAGAARRECACLTTAFFLGIDIERWLRGKPRAALPERGGAPLHLRSVTGATARSARPATARSPMIEGEPFTARPAAQNNDACVNAVQNVARWMGVRPCARMAAICSAEAYPLHASRW